MFLDFPELIASVSPMLSSSVFQIMVKIVLLCYMYVVKDFVVWDGHFGINDSLSYMFFHACIYYLLLFFFSFS